MERDPFEGGRDVGRDIARDLSDEPPPAIRDAPPDILSPIDESAPVSGHTPPPETRASAVDSPEHDWGIAREMVRPAFRPVGTSGLPIETVDRESLSQHAMQSHPQPLLDMGPAGLRSSTPLPRRLRHPDQRRPSLVLGIEPTGLQDPAMANLPHGRPARVGPTRSTGTGASSARHRDGYDAGAHLLPTRSSICSRARRRAGSSSASRSGTCWSPHPATGGCRFAARFSEFVTTVGRADEPASQVFELVTSLVEFS